VGWGQKEREWVERLAGEAWELWWGMDPAVRAHLSPWSEAGPLLARLGPPVQALLKYLRHPDPQARRTAAEAIGEMGPAAADPEVVNALLGRLHDRGEAWPVRRAAARALGAMGSAAAIPEVITALLERFRDAHEVPSVREACALALEEMGPAAATPEAMRALLECFRKEDEEAECSPEGDEGDEDSSVRWAAADALRVLGRAATPEVIGALCKGLGDRSEFVRRDAGEALSSWHRQGVRLFRDASGRWSARTVGELSRGPRPGLGRSSPGHRAGTRQR
jgi:HEAT repeat protein